MGGIMYKSRVILTTLLLVIVPFTVHAEVMLAGLEAPVTVVRDANGIPHIRADNDHDLFFMQGRIHAQDRLFQMDLLRRSAAGTLAEVLGLSALPTDVETRTIGLSRAADLSLAAHPPEMVAILQAYSDGVNSYLNEAEAAGRLPLEYAHLGLTSVSMMFDFGPTGRFVAQLGPRKVMAETSLPGGESARPDSPYYLNLLEPYLRNETFQLQVSPHELK